MKANNEFRAKPLEGYEQDCGEEEGDDGEAGDEGYDGVEMATAPRLPSFRPRRPRELDLSVLISMAVHVRTPKIEGVQE